MAKGFAPGRSFILSSLVLGLIALSGCSQQAADAPAAQQTPDVETFPIENTQFKNCHFKDQTPIYSFNSNITPNPIQCDEGVANKVVLLSTNPLPNGVEFSMSSLSLTGTAAEKVTNVPYQFYIENSSGYQILNLKLTVK